MRISLEVLDYRKSMSCNDVVVITSKSSDAITAPSAATLANITYRQLDYWARRGWVTPSIELGVGRPGRRLYGPADVVKLAALGHFGRSGADVGVLGPKIASLILADISSDYVLVATGGEVLLVPATDLRAHLGKPGIYSVFDPAEVRARILAEPKPDSAGVRKTA
jgi:hypothetical protein